MSASRIVTLHPAPSAWLAELGASDLLVGGTDACAARSLRTDVRRVMTGDPSVSRALHAVERRTRDPETDLDAEEIARCAPDLVIADEVDDAWPDGLEGYLGQAVGRPVDVWRWAPRSLRDVLELALLTGRRVSRFERTMQVLGAREQELRAWRERIGLHRRAPDRELIPTVVLSSVDPPVLAGGWTAELVDRAALRLVGTASGDPARPTSWDEVRGLDPGIVIVAAERASWDAVLREAESAEAVLRPTARRRVTLYDPVDRLDLAGPGLHDAILDLAAWAHGLEGRNLSSRMRPIPIQRG